MTVHFVQSGDGLARRAFTVDDVRRMLESGIMDAAEPVELREGELIAMPAEKYAHARAMHMIARKLHRALGDDWTISQENTLQLGPDTLVQPDFSVLPTRLVRPSTEGFFLASGPELFIIEVADSSLLRDRTIKARLYARHLVREYWIVDLNGGRILTHRSPAQGAYQAIRRLEGDAIARPEAPGPTAFDLGASELG